MSIKFLVLGGGGILGWGGECRFYFYGREDFSDKHRLKLAKTSARIGKQKSEKGG